MPSAETYRSRVLPNYREGKPRQFNRLLKLAAALIWASLSTSAAALGEFDGVWVGRETANAGGDTLSLTTGTIIHQSSANTLHLFTTLDDRVLTLQRSGANWVLPRPQNSTVLGIAITLETFNLQFSGLNRFTANLTATALGVRVTGNLDQRRFSCSAIRAPYRSAPFGGAEDSLACFEIIVPEGALALRASTRGGSGDADLIVVYHKPDFRNAVSEGFDNSERVVLKSPQPGKWFVGVTGFTAFAGLTLSVTIDEVVLTPILDLLLEE